MTINLQDKPVFWDYKNINLESELGQKTYIERIIVFGSWAERDLPMIKKYYKTLNLSDYWKNYFNFYFSKYDIN